MSGVKRALSGIRARTRGASPLVVGLIALGAVVLFGYFAFQKTVIFTTLSFGDTIQAEFDQGYKLEPYHSEAKIADVIVGRVTAVERSDRGTALVTMKLDSGIIEKLGEKPSALVSATTLLGGTYYVDLMPGGNGSFTDELIPRDRTGTPVELGDALTAFTPGALESLPKTIGQLDSTLQKDGREAIRALVAEAPATLRPTGEVLAALRGNRPDTDLTDVVRGLRTTAVGLLRNPGQLAWLLQDLNRATAALAAGSRPLAESLKTAPETLRITRAGLSDLQGTLNRLTTTADSLRPTARKLDSLLEELDPVLVRARPVVHDLRVVLEDLRPLIAQLNPTVDNATEALSDLRGPVLDRVNGPIADTVLNSWHGTGVYPNGGSDNKLYEELAYLAANGSLDWQTHDGNGTLGRLMAGAGGQTIGGSAFPMTAEEYLETLGLQQPPGPQADAPGRTSSPMPVGVTR